MTWMKEVRFCQAILSMAGDFYHRDFRFRTGQEQYIKILSFILLHKCYGKMSILHFLLHSAFFEWFSSRICIVIIVTLI